MLKSIPGIPQGPRIFNQECHNIFTKILNLVRCKSEPCLYLCTKRKLYLLIWVDDIFLFYPKESSEHAQGLWKGLREHLDLDEWEDIGDCLSCVVTRDRARGVIKLSQEAAATKLVQRNEMNASAEKKTPMSAGLKLTKKDCPDEQHARVMKSEQRWYRSTLASVIWYVSWTRPDLAYAVSKLCKFCLLYTSPSPRDKRQSRMPSSA